MHPYRGFWPSAIPLLSGASLGLPWGLPGTSLGPHGAVSLDLIDSLDVSNRAPLSRIRAFGHSEGLHGASLALSRRTYSTESRCQTVHPHRGFRQSATPRVSQGPPWGFLSASLRPLGPPGVAWSRQGALPLGPPEAIWGLLAPPEFVTVFAQVPMEPFRRHVSGSSCTFRSPYYL